MNCSSIENKILSSNLRHGIVTVVQISHELKSALKNLLDMRTVFFLNKRSKERILNGSVVDTHVLDNKEEIEFQLEGDCFRELSWFCEHILDELSASDLNGPESLSALLDADNNSLNLIWYQTKSSDEVHEDRGLVTVIYSPGDNHLENMLGQSVELGEDQVAVCLGAAVQAATTPPDMPPVFPITPYVMRGIDSEHKFAVVFRAGGRDDQPDPCSFLPLDLVVDRQHGSHNFKQPEQYTQCLDMESVSDSPAIPSPSPSRKRGQKRRALDDAAKYRVSFNFARTLETNLAGGDWRGR